MKRKDVRSKELVDFEGIVKDYNVDVMLYESKIDSKKDVGSMWQLVCGKIQYKTNFPTVNMGGRGGGRCGGVEGRVLFLRQQIWVRYANVRNVKAGSRYLSETKI